jgi:hypothetical protein
MVLLTEWTAGGWEVGEVDLELNSDSIWCRGGSDRALDVATRVVWVEELGGRKGCCVDWPDGVVGYDRCIAKNLYDQRMN